MKKTEKTTEQLSEDLRNSQGPGDSLMENTSNGGTYGEYIDVVEEPKVFSEKEERIIALMMDLSRITIILQREFKKYPNRFVLYEEAENRMKKEWES